MEMPRGSPRAHPKSVGLGSHGVPAQPLAPPGAAQHGGLEVELLGLEAALFTEAEVPLGLAAVTAPAVAADAPEAAKAAPPQSVRQSPSPRAQRSPRRPRVSRPAAKVATRAEPLPWGRGTTRVLVAGVVVPNAFGKLSFLESAGRLEQWCRRCGIEDVVVLALPEGGEAASDAAELRQHMRALGARCQPGDVCVMHLAGLDSLVGAAEESSATEDESRQGPADKGGGGDAAAAEYEPFQEDAAPKQPVEELHALAEVATQPESSIGAEFLAALPPSVTVVCVVDACCEDGEVLTFGGAMATTEVAKDQGLRIVTFAIRLDADCNADGGGEDPESSSAALLARHRSSALCAAAIMRTADALSLADRPCSLTCSDFFFEMEDQVRGLADAGRLPPPDVALTAHPENGIAGRVRWPIAPRPLEMTGDSAAGVWRPFVPERPPAASNVQARIRATASRTAKGPQRRCSERVSSLPVRPPLPLEAPVAAAVERARSSLPGLQASPAAPARSERARSSAPAGQAAGEPRPSGARDSSAAAEAAAVPPAPAAAVPGGEAAPPAAAAGPREDQQPRKPAPSKERGRRGGSQRAPAHAGGARAMPSGIGDLSMMLTGGGRMTA